MLSRLETMILMGMEIPLPAVRRQIASGIDVIIHVGRMRDRSRKVLQIMEVLGYDNVTGEILTQTLYEFEEEDEDLCGIISGRLVKRNELSNRLKLLRAGFRG